MVISRSYSRHRAIRDTLDLNSAKPMQERTSVGRASGTTCYSICQQSPLFPLVYRSSTPVPQVRDATPGQALQVLAPPHHDPQGSAGINLRSRCTMVPWYTSQSQPRHAAGHFCTFRFTTPQSMYPARTLLGHQGRAGGYGVPRVSNLNQPASSCDNFRRKEVE